MHHRPAWLEIDLSAIGHNIGAIKEAMGTDVMAIVKANAYGHGLVPVARAALSGGANALGVALLQEGLTLRSAGIESPIVVLGPALPDQANALINANLSQVVSDASQIEALAKAEKKENRAAQVHLKIDTGMGRVGTAPQNAPELAQQIADDPHLILEGLATHIAWECENLDHTRTQIACFTNCLAQMAHLKPRWRHVANSVTAVHVAQARFDLVRAGLLLYGIPPSGGAGNLCLRPALSLHARITQVRGLLPGQKLSYGGTFTVQRPSRIALLPLGYADGYNRRLSNCAHALVRGQACPVVGTVCMDLTLIDVTDVPGIAPGEPVVLLGQMGHQRITVGDLAQWMDGIPHEVVAQLSTRLHKCFINVPPC